MQIVFMTYESTSRKITQQVGATGKAPTNLIYLHPYLTDFHWNLIAQRVANFGNENCVRQLVSSFFMASEVENRNCFRESVSTSVTSLLIDNNFSEYVGAAENTCVALFGR